jgi:hypothetical protein
LVLEYLAGMHDDSASVFVLPQDPSTRHASSAVALACRRLGDFMKLTVRPKHLLVRSSAWACTGQGHERSDLASRYRAVEELVDRPLGLEHMNGKVLTMLCNGPSLGLGF